jgi:hypothetical protein
VLTDDEHERSVLLASGSWEEVCNPIVSVPGICARSDGNLTADGPFQTFAQPGPGRVGLHRCWSGVANFFSTDPLCEGRDHVRFLGYVSQARTSASPRPLCRCFFEQATVHFHWLGEQCPALPGVRHEAVLGYVR